MVKKVDCSNHRIVEVTFAVEVSVDHAEIDCGGFADENHVGVVTWIVSFLALWKVFGIHGPAMCKLGRLDTSIWLQIKVDAHAELAVDVMPRPTSRINFGPVCQELGFEDLPPQLVAIEQPVNTTPGQLLVELLRAPHSLDEATFVTWLSNGDLKMVSSISAHNSWSQTLAKPRRCLTYIILIVSI